MLNFKHILFLPFYYYSECNSVKQFTHIQPINHLFHFCIFQAATHVRAVFVDVAGDLGDDCVLGIYITPLYDPAKSWPGYPVAT